MDRVREAAKLTATKSIGNLPKYKLSIPMSHDVVTSAILEWRIYLAKTCDWKPDQVFKDREIPVLSKWIVENEVSVPPHEVDDLII